jgi:myosin heavy subunit
VLDSQILKRNMDEALIVVAHNNEVLRLQEALKRRDEEIRQLQTALSQQDSSVSFSIERMKQAFESKDDISRVIYKCAQVLAREVSSREGELRSCELALSSERELSESLADELRRMKDRLSEAQEENASLRTECSILSECSGVVRESARQAAEEAEAFREKLSLTQDQLTRSRAALKEARADLDHALSGSKNGPETGKASVGAQEEALEQELCLVRGDLRALISLGLDEVDGVTNEESSGQAYEASMLSVLRMTNALHWDTRGGLASIRAISGQIEAVLQSALLKTGSESNSIVMSTLVQEMKEILSISKSRAQHEEQSLAGASNNYQLKELQTDTFSTPIRNPFAVDLESLEGGWAQSGTDSSSFFGRVTDESDLAGLDSWDLPPMTPPPCFD